MMKVGFLRAIRPHIDDDTDEREPIRTYCRRIHSLVPNFPTSCTVQWLYRHFESIADRYKWLDFDHLVFEKEWWPTDRIVNEVRALDESIPASRRTILWSDKYGRKTHLEAFMIKRGTWPRPIMILHNVGIPRRMAKCLPSPFHLLEGHRRAGYLHGLADRGLAKPQHCVWLISWSNVGAI
jgi:hypothetical protein